MVDKKNNSISEEQMVITKKDAIDFSRELLRTGLETILFTVITPTQLRRAKEMIEKKYSKKKSDSEDEEPTSEKDNSYQEETFSAGMGQILGACSGITLSSAMIVCLASQNPKYLIPIAATQAISLAYEGIKYLQR